ncbi:hypothetical protein [Bowmanella sp. JS7-9]|uniref:Uncharacterized protein n=1 Tax=Pseudobowmanella zhangzhouensis TaxID=1537679 RepID=A0ABW1XJC6_9ALTE|nr:hypothetical protein [Bowmanella sp. JS7-9]TBX26011.1 hypothetical protein TK45_02030 [Bowmanella sp. JS7-9]
MTIQDGNAERRNLTVLAFMIVVYYLGGGQPIGNEIKLSMISVEFTNPTALKSALWVVLAWFAYRHWVANRKPYVDEYNAIEPTLTWRSIARFLLSDEQKVKWDQKTSPGAYFFRHKNFNHILKYWGDTNSNVDNFASLNWKRNRIILVMFSVLAWVRMAVLRKPTFDFWMPLFIALLAAYLSFAHSFLN